MFINITTIPGIYCIRAVQGAMINARIHTPPVQQYLVYKHEVLLVVLDII